MLTGRRTACTADLSEGSCTPSWLAKVSTFEPNGLSEKRNEGKEKKQSSFSSHAKEDSVLFPMTGDLEVSNFRFFSLVVSLSSH